MSNSVADLVVEVSAWADLALVSAGLEAMLEVVDDGMHPSDFEDWLDDETCQQAPFPARHEDAGRVVFFVDKSGNPMPVHVFVDRDGGLSILLSEGDAILALGEPRGSTDLEGMMADLVRALAIAMPVATLH